MYDVKFYDKSYNRYDFCQFGIREDENLFDKFEEVLDIVRGLKPLNIYWVFELGAENDTIFFDNCGNVVKVKFFPHMSMFCVYDII